MPDNVVDSFLAEIGFAKPDTSGARAIEDLVNRTETRITEIQAREGAKRATVEGKGQAQSVQRINALFAKWNEAEEKSQADRAQSFRSALADTLGFKREHVDQAWKLTKENAAKEVTTERDKAKKIAIVHDEQFKRIEAGALRLTSIFSGVSTGLGGIVSALPLGAFAMGVERTAASLSRLDVQAKRTGSSAAGIQRFLFALKQQGVDEGEASGALEGFAKTIQSNPTAYRQALEGLPKGGVRTLGPDGKPLDNDALLENFGAYLGKLDLNIARIQAGQFGVTGDNAINALRDRAGTRAGLDAYDAKLKTFGVDPNKAAEDARKVTQSWNSLEADFAIIKQKLDAEFFLPFVSSMDAIAKKLEENPKLAEGYGRALEALGAVAATKVLPPLANLFVKLSGLEAILGGSVGTLLGIATNPIVALGASAESTPGAGVPADAAERARVAEENRRLTDEANRKQGSTGSFWQDSWNYIKGKVGLGDDKKVAVDIATTAESTKKLADAAGMAGGEGGGGSGGAFGSGGSGGHMGYIGRVMRAFHPSGYRGKGNFGEKGWWTPERQGHAIDALMKNAGLTEDGAKALVARWRFVESAGGPASVNPYSGAEGIAQWLGSRKGGGSNGTFDEQLAKVARELNDGSDGSKGVAKMLLNTPGREAEGASAYERAEGYAKGVNAGTHRDNYTDRVAEGMKHIVHGTGPTVYVNGTPSTSSAAAVPTSAASTAGPSAKPVTDGEVFAARQRVIKGSRDPKDRAIIERYGREQTAHVGARGQALQPTGDAAHPVQERTLGRYIHVTKPMAVRGEMPHPTVYGPSHLDAAQQKLADAMNAEAAQRMKTLHVLAKAMADGALVPKLHPHALVSSQVLNSIRHGDRSQHIERHGDTFHIHGADAKSGLDHAMKVSARREGQDRIRYGQG